MPGSQRMHSYRLSDIGFTKAGTCFVWQDNTFPRHFMAIGFCISLPVYRLSWTQWLIIHDSFFHHRLNSVDWSRSIRSKNCTRQAGNLARSCLCCLRVLSTQPTFVLLIEIINNSPCKFTHFVLCLFQCILELSLCTVPGREILFWFHIKPERFISCDLISVNMQCDGRILKCAVLHETGLSVLGSSLKNLRPISDNEEWGL